MRENNIMTNLIINAVDGTKNEALLATLRDEKLSEKLYKIITDDSASALLVAAELKAAIYRAVATVNSVEVSYEGENVYLDMHTDKMYTFELRVLSDLELAQREDKVKQAVLVAAIEQKRQFDEGIAQHNAEVEQQLAKATDAEKIGINIGNAIVLSALVEMGKQLDDKMAHILEDAGKARARLNELTQKGEK